MGHPQRDQYEEINQLVAIAPRRVSDYIKAKDLSALVEIILDLGRAPLVRFLGGDESVPGGVVTEQEIGTVVAQLSEFGGDNRAGIPRTLHRISAIRNRGGKIVGQTLVLALSPLID